MIALLDHVIEKLLGQDHRILLRACERGGNHFDLWRHLHMFLIQPQFSCKGAAVLVCEWASFGRVCHAAYFLANQLELGDDSEGFVGISNCFGIKPATPISWITRDAEFIRRFDDSEIEDALFRAVLWHPKPAAN